MIIKNEEVRIVVVERCSDIPGKTFPFEARIGKCEECKQDVYISKPSDNYMNKYTGERIKVLCKPCWDNLPDHEDVELITLEECIHDFDEWHLKRYGYKLSRDESLNMMENYIGKRPKVIK